MTQAMSCKWSKGTSGPSGDECHNLVCAPLTTKPHADNDAQESKLVLAFHDSQAPNVSGDITHLPGRKQGQECCIVFTEQGRTQERTREHKEEQAYCLTNPGAGGRTHSRQLFDGMGVRRLTPRECERLQGFPDDYTAIIYRGKPAADGPRYRALGNSFAVPVIRWIGERIKKWEEKPCPKN